MSEGKETAKCRVDLHIHSNCSGDGEYSPRELMVLCRNAGIEVAALADHNTVRGVGEALEWAGRLGLKLIPAVELDCTFQGVDLHLLGYGIDPANPAFAEVERNVLDQERQASRKRIALVGGQGIAVDAEEVMRLAPEGVAAGELIAELALLDERNADNPLLRPYRPGGPRSDNPYVNFYWDFCAQGKPAYVPIRYPGLDEAVRLVRGSGGVAVLAHPGNNTRENETLLRGIATQGIDGMEVYSSYHSPAQTVFYRELTTELRLRATCGSDFHGKTKPSIALGSVGCEGRESEILSGLPDGKPS